MWILLILLTSLWFFWRPIKQYCTYKLYKFLVEVHHKHYIVHYPYGLTWYSIMIPRRRGPSQIEKVMFGSKDVTEEFRRFAGPCENFHGITTTPKMLGHDLGITITTLDDEIVCNPDFILTKN